MTKYIHANVSWNEILQRDERVEGQLFQQPESDDEVAILGTVGASRLLRFSIEGTLAILIGKRLLRLARTRTFEDAVVLLMVVSILGSILSIYTWVKRSRTSRVGGRRAAAS